MSEKIVPPADIAIHAPTSRMALSHSRLSDFNQCPRKFYLKYISKAENFQMKQEDKSIHLVRGDNVHKALEAYLVKRKAGEQNIPPSSLTEVQETRPLIEGYIKAFGIDNIHPEAQIAINDKWEKVTWFDKQAYYRAILDLICLGPTVAVVGDYKTGKFKDYAPTNGMGQLELTSAIALSIFQIEEVKTIYFFVDHKKTIQKNYTSKDKTKLVDHFIGEHDKVNAEKNFDPKSNEFCTWCEATKAQCPKSRKL